MGNNIKFITFAFLCIVLVSMVSANFEVSSDYANLELCTGSTFKDTITIFQAAKN